MYRIIGNETGCQFIICNYGRLGVNTPFNFAKVVRETPAPLPLGKRWQDNVRPSPAHGKEVRSMNVVNVEAKENKSEALKDKYLLTIKEAAFYFNIGTKKMRRIAEDNLGNVAVFCGNRFLIVRPKFEEFILNSSEI